MLPCMLCRPQALKDTISILDQAVHDACRKTVLE